MNLITPVGLMAFANVIVPRSRSEGKEPDFNATLVFNLEAQNTPEYREMHEVVNALAHEKAGKYASSLTSPWHSGSEKSEAYPDAFTDDDVYINMWSKYQPGIVDRDRNPLTEEHQVWAGQTARMQLKPFYWEVSGKRGISFGLQNIQIIDTDGPHLDGRMSPQVAFAQATPLLGYRPGPRVISPMPRQPNVTPPQPQRITTPPQGSGRIMAPKPRPMVPPQRSDESFPDDDVPF